MLSNKFKFQQAGKASIEPKPVRYRSNGSGRDSYIEASGHYIKQRRNVFESNLRNYQKSNNQSFGRISQMKTDESPGRRSRYPKVAGTTVIDTNLSEYEPQDPDYFIMGQNLISD